jgi:arginase
MAEKGTLHSPENFRMKNIKLIEVPSEIGAGTRGASLGIEAIKIAALDFMSNFFIHFPSEKIPTENKLLYEPIESPYAKRVKGIITMYERVSEAVSECIKSNFFPVVISGDHSIAGATITGIKIARPTSKLGVIWIDAHADLHTPYTTPSGNVHGMPISIVINEDNNDCTVHKVDAETAAYWKQLKNIGTMAPKVLPEDIVFISLRDFEKEEKYLIDKHSMKVITTSELRRKGAENIVKSVLRYLSDCTDIYISFDIDSMDAGISRGTGTPVSNGLREREAEDLISKFMQNRKICCFEISEVNPTLDKENLMAEIAFNILQRSVNVLMMN